MFARHLLYISLTLFVLTGAGLMRVKPVQAQCSPDLLFDLGFSIGGSGYALDTADFNEDGILDLVWSAAGSAQRRIAVADFNEDGILDVASNGLQVRLGLGAGSFGPTIYYGSGVSDSLSVYIGNGSGGVGDGTFSSAMNYPAGVSHVGTLVADDFNSDGILDLVIDDYSYSNVLGDSIVFAILPGEGSVGVGDGSFGVPIVHRGRSQGGQNDIQAGDFDEDGILDLAKVYSGTIYVHIGNGGNGVGDGSFKSDVRYYLGAGEAGNLELGDFDSDGIVDIVVGARNGYYNIIALLRGQGSGGTGDGTFATAAMIPASAIMPDNQTIGYPGLAVADFNHDGIDDIALTTKMAALPQGSSLDAVSVVFGNGTNGQGNGTFGAFSSHEAAPGTNDYPSLIAGDWNKDGAIDLIVGTSFRMLNGKCPDPNLSTPSITSVGDVPNDQGGKVSVAWERSPLDSPGPRMITGYTVWRRLSLAAAMDKALPLEADPQQALAQGDRGVRVRSGNSGIETYWEAMATVPAHFLEGYGYTASTTQDSIAGSNPHTAFFVSAITEDPFLFFESDVDSGYSVDNLAPMKPQGLKGQRAASDLLIHWNPNQEQDLSHYAVYRGLDPLFDPDDLNRVGATTDTTLVDSDATQMFYYKVSAFDIHGNESIHALLEPSDPPIAIAVLDLSVASTETGVVMQWGMSEEAVRATTEVRVQRSSSENGPYDEIKARLVPRREMSFRDTDVDAGNTYWYRPVLLSTGNAQVAGQAVRVTFTGFKWRTALYAPSVSSGSRNVDLRYSIGASGSVRLEIFDVAGRRLRSLDQGAQAPGEYVVPWNGLDTSGVAAARGVYLVRLVAGRETATRKIVRLR